MTPNQVIEMFLLLKDLNRTSNICSMSRSGHGFDVLMRLAETLKKIEDLT
jgi:hypothetical protein